MAARWSVFSLFSLLASSVGFPGGWTIFVGHDNRAKSLTQSRSASLARGASLPWTAAPADVRAPPVAPGGDPRIAPLSVLDLLRQALRDTQQSIVVMHLAVSGADAPAGMADVRSAVNAKEIAGLLPAFFAPSARQALETPERKQPSHAPAVIGGAAPIDSPHRCLLSGLAASTEAAHLFDATMPPKLILSSLQVSIGADPSLSFIMRVTVFADASSRNPHPRHCWHGCPQTRRRTVIVMMIVTTMTTTMTMGLDPLLQQVHQRH